MALFEKSVILNFDLDKVFFSENTDERGAIS
jgi:hypothetical protein